jgi:transposase InsO family protein
MCGHLLNRREPVVRYEYDEVGGLIHLDIKRVARFEQPGHRVTGIRKQQTKRAGWEYVHVCIDDYSRWSYAEVLPDQKGKTASAFLKRALKLLEALGAKVKRVMTDNGPCYKSNQFRRSVKAISARHIFTRPYRPQTNGKAERFIQTLSREWSYGRAYETSEERNSWLSCYLKWFNLLRPHGSLGAKPPISRLAAVNNVPELYS